MNRILRVNEEAVRSLMTSMLVALPCLMMAWSIIRMRITWSAPATVMMAILCLGVLNFVLTVGLEPVRRRIGGLTLPAILASSSVVFLFVLAGSFNRFVQDVNYQWLLPVVGMCLILSLLAIFRERILALKLYLAFNALSLSVLWGLGATGRVWLPF
jgi:hypothetical protein